MDMFCSAYDIIRITNKSIGREPHWEFLGSQVSVMPLATVVFQSREGCRNVGVLCKQLECVGKRP